jgi:hypothetical protein
MPHAALHGLRRAVTFELERFHPERRHTSTLQSAPCSCPMAAKLSMQSGSSPMPTSSALQSGLNTTVRISLASSHTCAAFPCSCLWHLHHRCFENRSLLLYFYLRCISERLLFMLRREIGDHLRMWTFTSRTYAAERRWEGECVQL